MASTDRILSAAVELGQLIAEHDASKKFEDAVKKLRDDVEAQRVLNDHNRQLQEIHEKQTKGEPIEVDDKHKLEKLQDAVIKHPLLRDLQVIQMDYMDLMRRVDEAIGGPMSETSASPGTAESPLANPDIQR